MLGAEFALHSNVVALFNEANVMPKSVVDKQWRRIHATLTIQRLFVFLVSFESKIRFYHLLFYENKSRKSVLTPFCLNDVNFVPEFS